MWICGKCSAEVNDAFTICGWCGTTIDGVEDPSFAAESISASAEVAQTTALETATVVELAAPVAEVLTSSETALIALAEPPPDPLPPPPAPLPLSVPSGPVWEPENKESLSANEYVRVLESKLSSLMDDCDTADWKVNPAFHPEVTAFIQGHADNATFLKRAQSLQQNRAKYYATMRAQGKKTVAETPPAVAPVVAVEPAPAESFPAFAPPAVEAKTKPKRSRVRRIATWVTFLLLITLFCGLGYSLYWRFTGEQLLQEVIASIVETDPNWRWEELQAARAEVPDDQNAALQVEVAAQESAADKDWDKLSELDKALRDLAPPECLSAKQLQELRGELLNRARTRALAEARALDGYSSGREPEVPVDDIGNAPDSAMAARRVSTLMRFDAILRVHESTADSALGSVRAILIAHRSIGDEPSYMSQLIRQNGQQRTCTTLERVLALGQASEAALARTQKLLEDEVKEPLLYYALRGGRARFDVAMERMATGDDSVIEDDRPGHRSPFFGGKELFIAESWLRYGEIREAHSRGLRLYTEAVKASQLPCEQQLEAFKGLDGHFDVLLSENPVLTAVRATYGLVGVEHQAKLFARHQAQLRCAITGLAVERYRLATNTWPDSLDELGHFLPDVPLDPFDGSQLRIRKHADGIAISSVGKIGELRREDIAFRLWDVSRRRQVPTPEEK
jgi:hypothetical protein